MSDLVNELRQGSLNKDDYRWRAADRIEQLEAALDILQAAMTAKKPIPMAFKKAILEARAALENVHSIGHEGDLCTRECT